MFCWKTAEDFEWKQIEAISLALSKHSKLLEFLFEKDRPCLKRTPEELLEDASCFSSGEQILVRVALDFWSSSGGTKMLELMDTLDQGNFENVLLGLQYLGSKQSGGGIQPFAN